MRLNPTRALTAALDEAVRLRKDGYRLTGWPALGMMVIRAAQGGSEGMFGHPGYHEEICPGCHGIKVQTNKMGVRDICPACRGVGKVLVPNTPRKPEFIPPRPQTWSGGPEDPNAVKRLWVYPSGRFKER